MTRGTLMPSPGTTVYIAECVQHIDDAAVGTSILDSFPRVIVAEVTDQHNHRTSGLEFNNTDKTGGRAVRVSEAHKNTGLFLNQTAAETYAKARYLAYTGEAWVGDVVIV